MDNNNKNLYLTSQQIYTEWLVWKNTSRITDRLAMYMKMVAEHLSNRSNFRGYPADLKEDMVSDAILKQLKNLKNMKEEKKDSFFSYLTRCCWCSFLTTIGRQYKYANLKKQLSAQYVDQFNQQNGLQMPNSYTKYVEQLDSK